MKDKSNIQIDLDDHALLRIAREEDVCDAYLNALNDQRSTQYMVVGREPETVETVQAYIRQNFETPTDYLFGLFIDGNLIATSRLHDVKNGKASIGILIFETQNRGQGWGSKVINAISDFAMKTLDVNYIDAGIDQSNEVSRKCFSKAGFFMDRIDPAYTDFTREIWVRTAAA